MEDAEFFERIQDPAVRENLAVRAGGEAFYAGLDTGDSIDVALDRSLHLVPIFTKFFEKAAESGTLPEDHSAQEWASALEEMDEGVRSSHEPSNLRKTVAGFLLRQEIRTSKSRIPTSLNKRREFRAKTA